MDLPALSLLPELRRALSASPLALLEAPPGSGKSTALPLELLNEPWLAGRKIVLLQPRRVAVAAVAARLAEGLGEAVGGLVGSRVRFESRVSARTRLEVVTEGVLTRRLQRDPLLEDVGLIIFDEFHERSLTSDLALALLLEVQGALRADLRALVMSATLGADLSAKLGGDVPILRASGRQFPVELRYAARDLALADLAGGVAGAVSAALARDAGDVLAFLPGAPEIRRAQRVLTGRHPNLCVLPLYGDLPLSEQRRALAPDPGGARRVVLATSIAETSLTLSGVSVVVDSGYARRARFDEGSGLTGLVTERLSRDAAAQRAGRAGRLGPGVAYRLWSERTQALLPGERAPEIMHADLAPMVLEIAQWGAPDPFSLPWPDPPPERHVRAARALLERLGALDAAGRVTERGTRLLSLPTHPRLAHLLLEGAEVGLGALACDVAALLEERGSPGRDAGADLTARVAALRAEDWRAGERADPFARARQLARQWRRALKVAADMNAVSGEDVGLLVSLAYPERVAQRRAGGEARYLLAGGRGARLPEGDGLAGHPYLAIAHLDAREAEGRIFLAAPLDPARLEARASWHEVVAWDGRAGALVARRERRVGRLVLEHEPLKEVPPAHKTRELCAAVRVEGLDLLPWTPETRQWRARVLSLRHWRPAEGWPDVSDAALLEDLEAWLGPHLNGVRRREDFAGLDLGGPLAALLPWPLSGQLAALAPTHLGVPSGHNVRLTYFPDGAAPVLAVKLQELFGSADTPAVNAGRTPTLLHLLSPAGRPVQVTQDLRGFWDGSYQEVRRELRGRYPKHPWPDDPWTAQPTRRAKPRRPSG